MPPNADSSEVSPEPSSPIGIVRDQGYVLEVGGPSGTIVSRETRPEEPAPDREPKKDPSEAVEEVVDEASSVTTKVERADALYADLADGSVELAQVDSAVDSLVGLLEHLDREGKHEEALRVARTLSKLLSLARRWLALLKALQAALRAGQVLGNDEAIAWAKHELGTAHLVRGELSDADRQLGEARELRERLNDRPGLAATTRNLEALCGRLRRMVREKDLVRRMFPRLPRRARPLVLAAVALALLAAGGAAGAELAGGSGNDATTTTDGNGEDGNGGKDGDGGQDGDGKDGGGKDGNGGEDGDGEDGDGGKDGKDGDGEDGDGNGDGNDDRPLTVVFEGDGSGTVGSSPTGIEECSEECAHRFPTSEPVTLTAVEDRGSVFTGFSTNCPGDGKSCTVTMTEPQRVIATFEPLYEMTVEVKGKGSGLVTSSPGEIECRLGSEGGPGKCNDQFLAGKTVTLTAGAVGESRLEVAFSSSPSRESCSGKTCALTMDQTYSVTARFGRPVG